MAALRPCLMRSILVSVVAMSCLTYSSRSMGASAPSGRSTVGARCHRPTSPHRRRPPFECHGNRPPNDLQILLERPLLHRPPVHAEGSVFHVP